MRCRPVAAATWLGALVGVAAELDLPGDDQHQVRQLRPPAELLAAGAATVSLD